MSKLTLQDYQAKSINDLFMAVIVENLSEEEAKRHMESLTPQDEDYKKVKEEEELIDSAIADAIEKSPQEPNVASRFADIMKLAISFCFEKTAPIIVLKDGENYINVNDDEEIDMKTHTLRNMEHFSDYYSEDEYRFIEMDGRVVLDVDSMEPWERYIEKVKAE